MAKMFYGTIRGEVRVNFLALFASKPPHFFMRGALNLFRCECSFELLHSESFCGPGEVADFFKQRLQHLQTPEENLSKRILL